MNHDAVKDQRVVLCSTLNSSGIHSVQTESNGFEPSNLCIAGATLVELAARNLQQRLFEDERQFFEDCFARAQVCSNFRHEHREALYCAIRTSNN